MDRYLGFRILIQTETFEESVTFFKDFLEIFKITIMRRFLDGR